MMRSLRQILCALMVFGVALPASAEKMSGLQFSVSGDVESRVKSELKTAYAKAFKANSKWQLIDTKATRAKLNPIVRDCFTDDCLKRAGKATKTKAGIRVQVSGESQIYDWTIETYDLSSGEKLASRKGSCELCGQSEVARTFQSTVSGVLKSTKVGHSHAKAAATPKKHEPKPEPAPKEPLAKRDTISLVKILISVEPPDAIVTFRDAEIGRGRTEVEVGPGNHEFMFEADGHRIVKELIVVDSTSPESIALRVHLPKKDAAPTAVPVASGGVIDSMGDTRMIWGLAATGTGVIFVGLGMYLTAIDGEAACESGDFNACPEVYKTGAAGFITTFTGTILLTSGVALLLWDLLAGEAPDVAEPGVEVAPAVVDGNAGLSIFGRF